MGLFYGVFFFVFVRFRRYTVYHAEATATTTTTTVDHERPAT